MPDADTEQEPAGVPLLHPMEGRGDLVGRLRPDVDYRGPGGDGLGRSQDRFRDFKVTGRVARNPNRAVSEILQDLNPSRGEQLVIPGGKNICAITAKGWSRHNLERNPSSAAGR